MRTILFVLLIFAGTVARGQVNPCDEYTAIRLDKIESEIVELRKLISERCPSVARQASACTCNPCTCVNCPCKPPSVTKASQPSRPTITCKGTAKATADWRAYEMQALFAKGYDVNFEIDNTLPLRFAYSWKPEETRGYLPSDDLPEVNAAASTSARIYSSNLSPVPPIRDSPTIVVTPTPTIVTPIISDRCYIDANGKRICPNASPVAPLRLFRR